MTEIIIAFITGILGPVILLIVRSYLQNRKKPDLIAEAVNNANIINDELDMILDEYSGDRVWLLQFHNGGHYYPTGKSIQKFSIFFESVKNHKNSIRADYQNIPVNLFSKALSHILNNDYIAIADYKDDAISTYGLKYIAEEHNSKSSYLFAIRNVENRLIGVLVVDYTGRKKTLTADDVIKLRLEATKLGGVLTKHI